MPRHTWASVALVGSMLGLLPGPLVARADQTTASTTPHIVQPDETLSQIALDAGVDASMVAALNGLDDANLLFAGQTLKLPAPAAPPTAPPAPPRAAAEPGLLISYIIQPGETLSQIARQFGVRADAIAQASALDDPNKLSIGAVLKVPVPAKEHVVSPGETLRAIAAGEKVDLGSLIDFNQIADPQLIRVGQVLVLPVPADDRSAPATPAATPTPQTTQTPAIQATPAPAQIAAAVKSTPRPVAPAVVATPPKDAPTDGLAGAALKLLGSPYVFGGSSPNGFDCSGFVWYVAHQLGKPMSRGMLGEYNAGSHPAREELKPGDLVFFQNTYSAGLSHDGVYIGTGLFVHAADEKDGVTISSLNTAYWSIHWYGATRLP